MALQGEIARAFGRQAEACRNLGSPFTADLCDRLSGMLDEGTELGRAVAGWPLNPADSALPLRLCGALHRLVRVGQAPALAALYPPNVRDGSALDAALEATIAARGAELIWLLASAPQTNEVARSGILLGGLLAVAAETGLPIALNEIGSSAGLNLHPDRYAYDFGAGRRWGPADSSVLIACAWSGAAPPLGAPLRIVARAGADLAPIDAADAEARERMLGYIWPDQPVRLARAAGALAIAAAHPAPIARAEAADWVEAMLAAPAPAATVRVLMHSITWQYLPRASQERIGAAMERAGAEATPERPLAWLRLEPDGQVRAAAILLSLWPGGRTRRLGYGCYHGRFAEWEGA